MSHIFLHRTLCHILKYTIILMMCADYLAQYQPGSYISL